MIKRIILFFAIINLTSCAEDLTDFEGMWQCNDGSATIYTFKKINSNSYLLKWNDDNYLTGIVNSKGVFETGNNIFAIDSKTKQLVLPEDWPCRRAAKLIMLSEEKEISIEKKDTVIAQSKKAESVENKIDISNNRKTTSNSKVIENTSVKNEIPENITKILSKESTNYNCLIRQFLKNGEYKLLTVDFIQLKKIDANNEQYYQVINTNPKLRTFLFTDKTKLSPSTLNLKSFETNNDEGQVFNISTRNGEVVALTKKL